MMIRVKTLRAVLSLLPLFLFVGCASVQKDAGGDAKTAMNTSDVAILGALFYGQGDTIPLACADANEKALEYCATQGKCYDPCQARSCVEQADNSFECTAFVHHHAGSCRRNGAPKC